MGGWLEPWAGQDAECVHAAARHSAGVKRARDRRGADISDARISQLQDCEAAWRRGGGGGGYGSGSSHATAA